MPLFLQRTATFCLICFARLMSETRSFQVTKPVAKDFFNHRLNTVSYTFCKCFCSWTRSIHVSNAAPEYLFRKRDTTLMDRFAIRLSSACISLQRFQTKVRAACCQRLRTFAAVMRSLLVRLRHSSHLCSTLALSPLRQVATTFCKMRACRFFSWIDSDHVMNDLAVTP